MLSVKAGDLREAASCAGIRHGGEQGRERGGWGWLGRSWAREKESRGVKEPPRIFWKMVYGKFFRKLFFLFFF